MIAIRKYRHLGVWSFCLRMAFESFLIAMLVCTVANLLFDHKGDGSENGDFLSTYGLVSALLLAPIFETVFCQLIPVAVARKLRAGMLIQVVVSMFVFAYMHFKVLGIVSGLSAGLVGGFYFSYTYVRWRERNLKTAYWSTVAVHSMYNFFIVSTVYLFSSV